MRARPAALAALGLLLAAPAWAHGPTLSGTYSKMRPQQLSIRAGDTVHFRNANSSDMTATFVAEDGHFESPALTRGEGWHFTFETPGVYEVKLAENGDNRATIVVGEPAPADTR